MNHSENLSFLKWLSIVHRENPRNSAYDFMKNKIAFEIIKEFIGLAWNQAETPYDFREANRNLCSSLRFNPSSLPQLSDSFIKYCDSKSKSEIKLIYFELIIKIKKRYSNIINLKANSEHFYDQIFKRLQESYPETFPNNLEEYENYILMKKALQ
jgi:hypothetical protein